MKFGSEIQMCTGIKPVVSIIRGSSIMNTFNGPESALKIERLKVYYRCKTFKFFFMCMLYVWLFLFLDKYRSKKIQKKERKINSLEKYLQSLVKR